MPTETSSAELQLKLVRLTFDVRRVGQIIEKYLSEKLLNERASQTCQNNNKTLRLILI